MKSNVFNSFVSQAINRMESQVPNYAQFREGAARINYSGVQILCQAKQDKRVVHLSFFIEDREISKVAAQAILEDRRVCNLGGTRRHDDSAFIMFN